MRAPVVLDFETHAIDGWRAPAPVGLAAWVPGEKPRYFAWGHPTGNNCQISEAMEFLAQVVGGDREVLFHNAAFDLGVWEFLSQTVVGFNPYRLPYASPRVHDTMLLAFLADPNATELGLKPLAARWCGMPPEEQDELREYAIAHGLMRRSEKSVGKYIAALPGDVVAPYAIGDVIRTRKLWDRLRRFSGPAYDRKRRILHLMRENTRVGVRVDVFQLGEDAAYYKAILRETDRQMQMFLDHLSPMHSTVLNWDANDQVADALEGTGEVTEWTYTAKSRKKSMAKGVLTLDHFKHRDFGVRYLYRQRLATCLSTFLDPWCEHAKGDGRIHPQWNIVASVDGGTRTGRFSSREPNFQNIPKEFTKVEVPTGFPPLPNMRRYLLPEKGETWHCRDYAQQEFRILAHMEDGPLLEAYRADPTLNMHAHIGTLIEQATGHAWEKAYIKQADFGYLYGIGARKLSGMLGISLDTAQTLMASLKAALPGVQRLKEALESRARLGQPITTWGGRRYLCEQAKVVGGELRSFEYKMLNTLIQGSAADCTEAALLAYHDHPRRKGRMLVPVHDEINVSGDEAEMEVLREAMEDGVRFDVPMLTSGASGPSWGEIE